MPTFIGYGVHDRDQTAALSIARIGCEMFGPKGPGSLGLYPEEASLAPEQHGDQAARLADRLTSKLDLR